MAVSGPERIDSARLWAIFTLKFAFGVSIAGAIDRTKRFSSTLNHLKQKQAPVGPAVVWRAREDSNL